MRHRLGLIGLLTLVLVLVASVVPAEVKTRGEIEGTVVGPDGAAIPAATVTLTGDALIQNQVEVLTNESGRFRLLNLLPGQYTVTVGKDAFASQQYEAEVTVGRTVTLDVALAVAGVSEEVTVMSETPVIDRGAPSLQTGFDETELAALPTTRNLYDIVDAAPGMHNRAAYGAGGNVEGYDYFGIGAATNNYQLNGVTTNNLRFGNTWVLPNYDTIEQIQVTGPGGGAEYADYSGATVNIITKSGTNQFHGSGAAYYTNHHLIEDNSGGIKDLQQPTTKNNTDIAATVGGPIIKEKLTFFAGLSTNLAQNAPVGTELYDDLDRESYSFRLDYAAAARHDFSAMYTAEPIQLDNLGLQAQSGPEVGHSREQDTYTGFLSWIGIWGANTISEMRYALVNGDSARLPNAGGTGLFDARVGLWFNTIGTARGSENERDHVIGNVTHYADDFLNSSHEIKVGLDYEDAWSNETQVTSGDALMYILPAGPNFNLIYAIVNYNSHTTIQLERQGAFAQDKISFGNATLTLGVRYDQPETSDDSTGKTIFDFTNWSPRVGFAYDFSGKGRSVGHASVGRYYDKVPTYGVGGYASAGQGPWYYYLSFADNSVSAADTDALAAATIQPQNLVRVFETSLVPIEDGVNNPHTDTFNLGFDQQIGRRSSIRLNYVNRDSTDFLVLTQFANPHLYEPFSYTSSFTGETFDIYRVLNPQTQRQFGIGNRDFNEQESEMAILQFRHQPTAKLEIDASVAWEHSTGTRDNNEVSILSLRTNGVDTDPNYEQNPFYIGGSLSQEREWNAKLRGFYRLPLGFNVAADVRWYAGHPYGAIQSCGAIPNCNDPYYFQVYLEDKDARTSPESLLTNLRASWDLRLGGNDGYTLSFIVDALNVFNEEIDNVTNIKNGIADIYPLESAERGQTVSAFGGPNALERGREFRFGARFVF